MADVKIFYLRTENFLPLLDNMPDKEYIKYSEGRIFKTEKRREQFCLGRYLLKQVLEQIYGIISPKIETLDRKPFVADCAVKFNLSHSKNIIMAAFSDIELGLDIEYMKGRDFESILNYLKRTEKNTDIDTFYRFWTKYEAGIKLKKEIGHCYSTKLGKDFMFSVCTESKKPFLPELTELFCADNAVFYRQLTVQ